MGVLNGLAVGLFGSPEDAHPTFAVQSKAQLESAVALPYQGYYESFADKLAALTRSIACNHGLVDGNKRLAVTVLHSTLLLNDYLWLWSDDDAESIVLRLVRDDSDYRWLSDFIARFSARMGMSALLDADDPESIGALLHEMQESHISTIYGLLEMSFDHLRDAHPETLERAQGAVEADLTPEQFIREWRRAITGMASGKIDEPPRVSYHRVEATGAGLLK